MIKCHDESGKNFGDFSTRDGEEALGISGVLVSSDWMKYTFTLPVEIKGNLIIGDYYSIELNEGWKVIKVNDTGDMEIIKREDLNENSVR